MAKVGGVRCSIEGRHDVQESSLNIGMGAAMIAAISAATLSSPAAMALVDERMSTEGTGLPFGLSDNLLELRGKEKKLEGGENPKEREESS
ncbi:hypothetical protein KIW84_032142 [Lathyrus oleraceus]|uniref:PSII 6.1 kDa protein n=1 Tax=Pisum sativum TaxID=3888 RepID=A0A9D4XWR7_PEA|nr:hypothetical protein KIW84_032142 [Pisum sativum]